MTSTDFTTHEEWLELKQNLDQYFLVVMALIIYFMQCGFAFLEAGAVRAKNTTNILMKNILDSAIGGIIYWACGFAFAFGDKSNMFFGYSNFFLYDLDKHNFAFYFFHFVFAATAATIVSGAMAERTKFVAYFVYSFVITGVVYPVVTHWAWSGTGWLAAECPWDGVAYQDFAGSGVVHVVGGVAGLMGTLALGPRRDQKNDGDRQRVQGHSVPLMCLGGFILFFGFFAFNGGSQAAISNSGDGTMVGKAIVNTVLAGSAGGISCITCYWIKTRKFSLIAAINGILTGMVSICAGCNAVEPWAAFVIGYIAGPIFFGLSELLFKIGVDDPLDAFAVHFGGGLWGVISVTLFASETGLFYNWDLMALKQITWNLIGVLVIISWTCAITAPMFFGLKLCKMLRVSADVEEEGLDEREMNEPAFPYKAWQNSQLFDNKSSTSTPSVAGDAVLVKRP